MKKLDLRASNIRESGYRVHVPKTGEERIAAFRSIVERRTFAKIDGTDVDLFSAGCVVQIHDVLSEDARAKFVTFRARRMVAIAYALIKKTGARVS